MKRKRTESRARRPASLAGLSTKELSAAETERLLDAVDVMIKLRKDCRQVTKRGDLVNKKKALARFKPYARKHGLSAKRIFKFAVAKEKLPDRFNSLARRLGVSMAHEVANISDEDLRDELIRKGLPRGSHRLPLNRATVRQLQVYLAKRREGSRTERPRRGPGVRWPHSLRTAVPGLLDGEVWGWLVAAYDRVRAANAKSKGPYEEPIRKRMKRVTREDLEVLRARVHALWEKLHETVESMGRGKNKKKTKKKRSPVS